MELDRNACLVCGSLDAGLLCEAHARTIERADVAVEQLGARAAHGVAALIGPGDVVLPIGERAVIGRDREACDVAVLHATVSGVHAYVARQDGAWYVGDADSRNGTWVDGVRVVSTAALAHGARLRVGAVTLYFVASAIEVRAPRARRTTQPIGPSSVRVGAIELATRGAGGILRGPGGTALLTARELELVRTLAARRMESIDPEWAYVGSRELAGALGFRSIEPGGDNVRELVCRLRKKLASVGGGGLVESKPNVGYRIAAEVMAA